MLYLLFSTNGAIIFVIALIIIVLLMILFSPDYASETPSKEKEEPDWRNLHAQEKASRKRDREAFEKEKENLQNELRGYEGKLKDRKFIRKLVLGVVAVIIRVVYLESELNVLDLILAIMLIVMLTLSGEE